MATCRFTFCAAKPQVASNKTKTNSVTLRTTPTLSMVREISSKPIGNTAKYGTNAPAHSFVRNPGQGPVQMQNSDRKPARKQATNPNPACGRPAGNIEKPKIAPQKDRPHHHVLQRCRLAVRSSRMARSRSV